MAFASTIYLIYQVNAKGLSPAFLALFGISSSTSSTGTNWNWCDTRVVSIIRPERYQLKQEGHNWILEGSSKRVVNFIEVEKWFANYCKISVEPVPPKPGDVGYQPALFVKFVDDKVEVLSQHGDGTFRWRGFDFLAPEFQLALDQIEKLSDGRVK